MWSRFRHSGRQKCKPGGTTNNYVRLLSLLLPKWKEGYQLMMGKLYQQITTKYFSCHQGKSGESVNKQHCFTATKHTCHQGSNISKDCSSLPASSSLWSSVQGLPVLHLSWSTPPRVYLDVQNLLHQQLRSPAMVQHQCLPPSGLGRGSSMHAQLQPTSLSSPHRHSVPSVFSIWSLQSNLTTAAEIVIGHTGFFYRGNVYLIHWVESLHRPEVYILSC